MRIEYAMTTEWKARVSKRDFARWWEARKRHGRIHTIDGKEFIGFCEACSLPIVEGDDWVTTLDQVYLHRACCPEAKKRRKA